MEDAQKKAVRPDWKVSIIPKDAGNATEPALATTAELEAVIANPANLQQPQPIEAEEELSPVPRYNANVPYTPQLPTYSDKDEVLMRAISLAVKNGWTDYHRYANDAVTIGLEGAAVVNGMQRQRMKVTDLLYDKEFCKALFGNEWQTYLKEMVVADPPLAIVEGFLSDK